MTLQPNCPPLRRPQQLLDPAAAVHGLRAAQTRVVGRDLVVDVFLFRAPPVDPADPNAPGPLESDPPGRRWRLVPPPGGAAVTVDTVARVESPGPHLRLTVGGAPDPGRYRLEVRPDAEPAVPFDPLRTSLPVRLRLDCPDPGGCQEPSQVAPSAPPSPVHDYLARDWRSLTAALLEYLQRVDPAADVSAADPTIALLELFAHAGDLLHYRLDRVATEAYLETARLRTSVKRHARLVDFRVPEPRSGAAHLHIDAVAAATVVHLSVPPEGGTVPARRGDVAADQPGSTLAFTLEADLDAQDSLGEIPIHDWGEAACCLPVGATGCVLVRPTDRDDWVRPGDLLAFEVVDPGAEAAHRRWVRRQQPWPTPAADGVARFRDPLPSRPAQIVQVTAVEPLRDPLVDPVLALTKVTWRPEDALQRDYPVGVDVSAGGAEVTVVRGNLVRAHHGRLVDGPPAATLAPRTAAPGAAGDPPAAWWLLGAGTANAGGPGLSFDPTGAPHRLDVRVTLPSGEQLAAPALPSLLDAAPGDLAVVVEVEDHEPPVIRFRAGATGRTPPLGSTVAAGYEVGGGSVGNVAANALRLLERDASPAGAHLPPDWRRVPGVGARNPVAAQGGTDPLPLDRVRRAAPEVFAVDPPRAVLAADYAATLARQPGVQRATARRSWSGAWPMVTAVVDLAAGPSNGVEEAGAPSALQALLDDVRMLGTEATVAEGTPVGLFIALDACLRPEAETLRARAEILGLLRPGDPRRPGLFHPSRLTLGGTVYLSAVVAAVAALPAVDAVDVLEARRLSDPPGTLREVLTFAADEVPMLDDDPDRPTRGRLEIHTRGGR